MKQISTGKNQLWMIFKLENNPVWYMFNGDWVNCCYVEPPGTYEQYQWPEGRMKTELTAVEKFELTTAAGKGEGTSFRIKDRKYIIEASGNFSHLSDYEIVMREFRPEGVTGNANVDMKGCLFYRSYITGPQGAHYELLKEENHDDEDIRIAKRYIKKNFDSVSVKIITEKEILEGDI